MTAVVLEYSCCTVVNTGDDATKAAGNESVCKVKLDALGTARKVTVAPEFDIEYPDVPCKTPSINAATSPT